MMTIDQRTGGSGQRFPFFVVLLTLLGMHASMSAGTQTAWGCPMCSENLPTGADTTTTDDLQAPGHEADIEVSLAAGFYYSILLMLAVPFSMMAGLGGALYFQLRKTSVAGAPSST